MSKTVWRWLSLMEVSEITGVDHLTVAEFIQREWICPLSVDELDEEDVARIHLIRDLRNNLGANDEAIPLILHLMDQLYYLRHQIKKCGGETR